MKHPTLLDGLARFPGSAIEAYLPVDDLHAASGKDEVVILQRAYFANGNLAKTNYADFPAEAVTFGNVPPVIYSETISDLEMLVKKP